MAASNFCTVTQQFESTAGDGGRAHEVVCLPVQRVVHQHFRRMVHQGHAVDGVCRVRAGRPDAGVERKDFSQLAKGELLELSVRQSEDTLVDPVDRPIERGF